MITLFPTYPNFVERHYGVVQLSVANGQLHGDTKFLKFKGTNDLKATITYDTLFTIPVGTTFRSPSLQRNKINIVGESTAGMSMVSFDPDDYAGTNFHGEGAITFIHNLPRSPS